MFSNTSAPCSQTLQLHVLKHFSCMFSPTSARNSLCSHKLERRVLKRLSDKCASTSGLCSQTLKSRVLKDVSAKFANTSAPCPNTSVPCSQRSEFTQKAVCSESVTLKKGDSHRLHIVGNYPATYDTPLLLSPYSCLSHHPRLFSNRSVTAQGEILRSSHSWLAEDSSLLGCDVLAGQS